MQVCEESDCTTIDRGSKMLAFSSAPENGPGQTEKSMDSVKTVHALEASAGRAAAQFIVRSKGDWGLATNKRLWRWIATSIACR